MHFAEIPVLFYLIISGASPVGTNLCSEPSQAQFQTTRISKQIKHRQKVFLEIIARSEGITVDEVKKEIALAISYALKSKDPKAQAFWKSVPCDGDSPTVEEIINYLAIQLSTIKN